MRSIRMFFQKSEVIEHGMIVGEVELALYTHRIMPRLDTCELNADIRVKQLTAGKLGEEIEMPPGAAELAVSRKPQSDRGLLVDDLFDLHGLDLAQLFGSYLPLLHPGARFLDARRPQQAADFVGAKRRFRSLHASLPKFIGLPRRPRRRDSARASRDLF